MAKMPAALDPAVCVLAIDSFGPGCADAADTVEAVAVDSVKKPSSGRLSDCYYRW